MTTNNAQTLEQSNDMQAMHGTVDVDIPIDVLWDCFTKANLWPRWNACMFWVRNRDLIPGEKLIWAFAPIRWWYLYKLPGIATLVEVGAGVNASGRPTRKVTWEITALPGFFARHTYAVEDLGNGRSRFGSWEKATGPTFRALRFFWLSHFMFVKNRSLQGARVLEAVYHHSGKLDKQTLPPKRRWRFITNLKALLGSLEILGMQYKQIVPDVHAVLGGGGNSLVVKAGDEVLVVDPKMPPYAKRLKNWIEGSLGASVTTVIDTHHHFDHTLGNILYPQARIIAHKSVPDWMSKRDGNFWRKHPTAIPLPANLVDDTMTLKVGIQEVVVNYVGQAHTAGDVWVYLRKGDAEIIATGDIGTLDHYCFFDTGEGGADPLRWIESVRDMCRRYPKAIFVPGHGPVATAEDMLRHAEYVEFLHKSVAGSRADGLDESGTVRNIDLSMWNLSLAPIFHYGLWFLSVSTNIRSVYQIRSRAN
jgi:glyoxylase-like metal-dependent hydrolase (beta-lactamase superfamily II)